MEIQEGQSNSNSFKIKVFPNTTNAACIKRPYTKKQIFGVKFQAFKFSNCFRLFKNPMEKRSYEWRKNVDNKFFTRAILADQLN